MYYDLTLLVTREMLKKVNAHYGQSLIGHIGTHFDVMNKEFPLAYLKRNAVIFNVSSIRNREITVNDIEINQVKKDMFVAFYTGCIKEYGYGNIDYFHSPIALDESLIEILLKKEISLIGIDAPGIRQGKKHTPMDQYCANHNVFVIENMDGMDEILQDKKYINCLINTYPVRYSDISGLPCRVVAEI